MKLCSVWVIVSLTKEGKSGAKHFLVNPHNFTKNRLMWSFRTPPPAFFAKIFLGMFKKTCLSRNVSPFRTDPQLFGNGHSFVSSSCPFLIASRFTPYASRISTVFGSSSAGLFALLPCMQGQDTSDFFNGMWISLRRMS